MSIPRSMASGLPLSAAAEFWTCSLTEIRELQSYQDDPRQPCTAVNAMLDDHISHVRSQITALQALEQQLVSLRASCNEGREINACGILTGISEESKQQLYRASSGRKD